jgi:hypothetical protein
MEWLVIGLPAGWKPKLVLTANRSVTGFAGHAGRSRRLLRPLRGGAWRSFGTRDTGPRKRERLRYKPPESRRVILVRQCFKWNPHKRSALLVDKHQATTTKVDAVESRPRIARFRLRGRVNDRASVEGDVVRSKYLVVSSHSQVSAQGDESPERRKRDDEDHKDQDAPRVEEPRIKEPQSQGNDDEPGEESSTNSHVQACSPEIAYAGRK